MAAWRAHPSAPGVVVLLGLRGMGDGMVAAELGEDLIEGMGDLVVVVRGGLQGPVQHCLHL